MFQASIKGLDFLPGDIAGRIPIQPLPEGIFQALALGSGDFPRAFDR
jgi:hypothetical protein